MAGIMTVMSQALGLRLSSILLQTPLDMQQAVVALRAALERLGKRFLGLTHV